MPDRLPLLPADCARRIARQQVGDAYNRFCTAVTCSAIHLFMTCFIQCYWLFEDQAWDPVLTFECLGGGLAFVTLVAGAIVREQYSDLNPFWQTTLFHSLPMSVWVVAVSISTYYALQSTWYGMLWHGTLVVLTAFLLRYEFQSLRAKKRVWEAEHSYQYELQCLMNQLTYGEVHHQ
jgi:hypothetical protein